LTESGVDAIVVAAGSSSRMEGVDKVWATVAGQPILALALAPFVAWPGIERIVVVTAAESVERLRGAPWLSARVSAVIPGGPRRQESVAAGVAWLREQADGPGGPGGPAGSQASALLEDDREARIVLVHDGARPAASVDLVRRVAEAAAQAGAAVPVLPIAETVKRIDGDLVVETVDRSALATAQTPQGFRLGLLERAYRELPPAGPRTWTDEAALLEACTIPVHAIPGEPGNLKVTVPADLARAEASLGAVSLRPGLGLDSHPFGPGEPLMLGGVVVSGAPRLAGHSDGDVVLHAVADALLGAAAMGDLGRLFPATAETPRGIASSVLVRTAMARIADRGFRPASVDVTIVGARPRLAGLLDEIAVSIAGLLGVPIDRVGVKASTGNLAGMEGAGRGISANAIAMLERIR
jgi:2-C-methyl-D-erythritol 4-phosphate cytidylyltransferase / 2-C-methyl-D-erythritol 2,4-cyclodiphosphate synthase